jgi:DNA repair ATPase RecN
VRPLRLKDTPAAQRWLEENQLESGRECLLRRVISTDGRSRGFINGTAVPSPSFASSVSCLSRSTASTRTSY